MAIDTADKRKMVANAHFRGRRVLPSADSDIDRDDRFILLGLYYYEFTDVESFVGRIRMSVGGIITYKVQYI